MIEKWRIENCISKAYSADNLPDLKMAVCEFMEMIVNEMHPPLDLNLPVYVKDDVDLKELCYCFEELDDRFTKTSVFDEFIIVRKDTREVRQYGYEGTVRSWWEDGKLRQ